MSAAVIIPVPVDHHGSGPGIPWQWGLAYILCAFVFWVVAAIVIIRHEAEKSTQDKEDIFLAVVMGGVAAALWPLVLVGYGVWRIVQHAIRPAVATDKDAADDEGTRW